MKTLNYAPNEETENKMSLLIVGGSPSLGFNGQLWNMVQWHNGQTQSNHLREQILSPASCLKYWELWGRYSQDWRSSAALLLFLWPVAVFWKLKNRKFLSVSNIRIQILHEFPIEQSTFVFHFISSVSFHYQRNSGIYFNAVFSPT